MREGQVRCPVCGRLAGRRATTCECGWTLSGPLRLGPVTGQMRDDFEAALNQRQQARDARVVARITADPGPYQDYIRGGPPDAAGWKAARQAAARDLAGASDENALLAGLGDLLGELRPGISITVVEVGADGITMTKADLDRFGSPRVSGTGDTLTWESMLPMLSGTPEERRFQLAGGMSQPDRELARDGLDRRLPGVPGGPLRVVCRVAGWEIPERAAAMAAAGPEARLLRVTGTADATPVRTLLADLAAKAPLKHAYQLMVAVVTPGSGAVSIQPRRLFAPGARPGTRASLPLRRMPGDSSEMVFAIFADGGPDTDPLALCQVHPPDGSFSLRAVLQGPGRVKILEPGHAKEYPGTWDTVRGEVPSRTDTAPGPLDLVCAIDLSGSRDVVRRRTKLVRGLADLLATHYGGSPWLRVGVVTCTEHVFERGRREDLVTERLGLGPPGAAAAWLKGKRGTDTYPDLAPVEDLLHEAFELLRGSRDRGRAAVLVTVAGRPPHPWPQPRDTRMPCPNRYTWTEEIGKLTRRAGARCVMVADDPAAGVEGAAGWQKLGPGGLHKLAETNAQRLAQYLGLIASQGQRLPLPLPDDLSGGIQ
jgi:hypothetical protein